MSEDISVKTEDAESNISSKEKQEARSFLRERFLRAITGLTGM